GLDDLEVAALAQARGQVAVELDDGEGRAMAGQQRQRHRAQARAYLDEDVALGRRDRVDDAVDDDAVGEEMLAEALARDVRTHAKIPWLRMAATPVAALGRAEWTPWIWLRQATSVAPSRGWREAPRGWAITLATRGFRCRPWSAAPSPSPGRPHRTS